MARMKQGDQAAAVCFISELFRWPVDVGSGDRIKELLSVDTIVCLPRNKNQSW